MSETGSARNTEKKHKICKCPSVDCDDFIKYELAEGGNYWVGCDTCCFHNNLPNLLARKLQAKIKQLEADNRKLKQDCLDFVDLGTDQFVTEKILKLEADNKELESNVKLALDCLTDKSNPYWGNEDYERWVNDTLRDSVSNGKSD